MLKILFIAAAITILTFILFAMMCTMIVASRSNESSNEQINEGDDDMFFKRQICPKCKVGKESYELDKHSEVCPYIRCWKNGKCCFYTPIEKSTKAGVFKRNKNKALVDPRKF